MTSLSKPDITVNTMTASATLQKLFTFPNLVHAVAGATVSICKN
jgi:hypothetical protein